MNPSVSLRLTPPFRQGRHICGFFNYSLFIIHYSLFITHMNPSVSLRLTPPFRQGRHICGFFNYSIFIIHYSSFIIHYEYMYLSAATGRGRRGCALRLRSSAVKPVKAVSHASCHSLCPFDGTLVKHGNSHSDNRSGKKAGRKSSHFRQPPVYICGAADMRRPAVRINYYL